VFLTGLRPALTRRRPVAESARSAREVLRRLAMPAATYLAALILLLLADQVCFALARLPVRVVISPAAIIVDADGQAIGLKWPAVATSVTLVAGSALEREYQIDGTDNTNNFTETPQALSQLAVNPYYQFQAWMRDNATYSQWRDVTLTDSRSSRSLVHLSVALPDARLTLASSASAVLTAELERPEAPAQIVVWSGALPVATLTFDRNDRTFSLVGPTSDGTEQTVKAPFFPERPLPFAAEVADTFLRTALWALALLGACAILAATLAPLLELAPARRAAAVLRGWRAPHARPPVRLEAGRASVAGTSPARGRALAERLLLRRWAADQLHRNPAHVAAAGILLGSLAFVLYVAVVQYHAEPHILDASAYYFQAKIFASGSLAAPVPGDLAAFQGPFMVAWQGRWFAQYPPATSAVLAIGLLLHVPWLIEPLLGTAALAGVYWLGRRMYDGRTALLAVGLLALSPFYTYLAASYLSHTVALACEVGYMVFLVRFVDTRRTRDLAIAAAALAVMFAARELSATLVGVVTAGWVLVRHGGELWHDRRRALPAVAISLAVLAIGLALYSAYNAAQTGNPLLLPRTLFSPADRYGFGNGVGFYGKHTLAAGLVNLDELLTSLVIDLYGWPFYLTLALVPLAFLRPDRARGFDWLNLSLAATLIFAQVGYFYHGIYLGPRYLYETLPMLALLTSRGATALAGLCGRAIGRAWPFIQMRRAVLVGGAMAGVALVGLVLCNLLFYLPRQLALHQDFTGLPAAQPVDVTAIYGAHLHHALVITDNWFVYNYVLWPLNDPGLRGDVLYALAPTAADQARLRAEYPNRTLYYLAVGPNGAVTYQPVAP
jgi:Dolichyl-phosphate-mannose-protein mannosyltransferase